MTQETNATNGEDRNERRDSDSASPTSPCCEGQTCGPSVDRRSFLKFTGASSLAFLSQKLIPTAGPFGRIQESDHFVPADKKLNPAWVDALYAKGSATWYAGKDLETIGMPVGGIAAGTVYLSGDGRLVYWDVMNEKINTGWGAVSYKTGRKPTDGVKDNQIVGRPPVHQGFTLGVTRGARDEEVKNLDATGFPEVRFNGEYPIGTVDFVTPFAGVGVKLQAFSPFIPLNAKDSALPATILEYTLTNTLDTQATVRLSGMLENFVMRSAAAEAPGMVEPIIVTGTIDGILNFDPVAMPPDKTNVAFLKATIRSTEAKDLRPPIAFESFEGENYGKWTVSGDAFGKAPAQGTLAGQNAVTGFDGKGLVNTFLGGDDTTGRLVSPAFTIERKYVTFLVGGGAHKEKTCVNLVIDQKVVRTATGKNSEHLESENWDVREFEGKTATIEIVDDMKGPWGHINVDRIEFRDEPRLARDLALSPECGSLAIALLSDSERSLAGRATLPGNGGRTAGAVTATHTLAPRETKTFTFVVAWHFPNNWYGDRLVGNAYARHFFDALGVVAYIRTNLARLTKDTRLWHDTFYQSTLPHWLLDRVHSTAANLATTTTEWWRNGRFWAWEGGGCCHGTCGHVWNYALTMARLFPELERSVREMQDFAPGKGLDPKTGAIMFRGENFNIWAGDAQGGYVMRAYREHLMTTDDTFLNRNWEAIKKATQFLIDQDADQDGLIESPQHQTYDEWYHGANTYVGAFYLGALRAAAAMAARVGDAAFNATCRDIGVRGTQNTLKRLWNGEYFIQDVDLKKHPDWQYKDGCLADQLLGQNLAQELGLGYLYPEAKVKAALQSIWKYDWAPDVGPQNKAHDPERWFAYPGEGGLFTCTWPKSKHMGPRSTRYRDEIWTGIEYQVAAHMIAEGMFTEGLAICRAIHERYHPSKRNPWNEVECGDHYARAMASWGVFTALAGFHYDGPDAALRFVPRITPEKFQCAFTAAEGFGLITQTIVGSTRTVTITIHSGRLRLARLSLGCAAPMVRITGRLIAGIDGKSSPIPPAMIQWHSYRATFNPIAESPFDGPISEADIRLAIVFDTAVELSAGAGDTIELTITE